MRFFTRAWALGELSDEETERIRDAYWHLLDSFLPNSPPQVNKLAGTDIHDGLIELVTVDHIENCVTMVLFSWRSVYGLLPAKDYLSRSRYR